MKARKLFFKECHIAGRRYHDADEVWNELEVGTLLELVRDTDNLHDPYAVAIVYNKEKEGDKDTFLIGYIPKGENEVIAGFLEMGWTNIFECRISKINPEEHYENQLHVTIRIKRNMSKR